MAHAHARPRDNKLNTTQHNTKTAQAVGMGMGMGPSQGRRVTLRHRCGSEASPLPTGSPRMHAFVSRPRPPMCTRVTRSAAYNAMYPGRLSTVCCPSEAPAMPLTTRPWKKPLEHSTCRTGQDTTWRQGRAGHHVATRHDGTTARQDKTQGKTALRGAAALPRNLNRCAPNTPGKYL